MRGPAIVVFGAAVRPDGSPSNTLRRRVEAAAACGFRHPDALFVPTGGRGRFGPPEAEVMAQLLRNLGVPHDRIVPEITGRDTLASVRAVAHLLRARRHTGLVYAASSAYHLPRCVLLLRLIGLRARACPPPASPAAGSFRRRWYWRLRELPALPFDTALLLALRLAGRA